MNTAAIRILVLGVALALGPGAHAQAQEQVVAAKLLADFDGKVQQAGTTGDRFIGQVYADLKAAK